jgi:hypothetical protein
MKCVIKKCTKCVTKCGNVHNVRVTSYEGPNFIASLLVECKVPCGEVPHSDLPNESQIGIYMQVPFTTRTREGL